MRGQTSGLGFAEDLTEVVVFRGHPGDIRQERGGGRAEWQGGLLEAGEVAGSSLPMDGTGLPVNVGVMPMEPWMTQDERQVRMVQDVELDGLVVIARQEH